MLANMKKLDEPMLVEDFVRIRREKVALGNGLVAVQEELKRSSDE
jgi:hypothetical protein